MIILPLKEIIHIKMTIMRKFVFTICFTFIAAISMAQQKSLPEEFFGLKFCEKYTPEQLRDAMKNNGTYFEIDNSEPYDMNGIQYLRYGFQDVTYGGRTYPLLVLMTNTNGVLSMVDFCIPNGGADSAALDSTYNVIKSELSKDYELTSFPIQDHPEVERFLAINNGVTLRLDKYTENGQTNSIEISYVSLLAGFMGAFESERPEIQDSFFGMKMGSTQTRSTIERYVGYRGKYLDEEYISNGKAIVFKDVSFAGRTWDFANFYLTEEGVLYEAKFSISLEDYGSYSDEWKQAQSTYDYYWQKLNEKYGEKEETDSDDGKYVTYIGKNDMAVIVSNERSQSKGGSFRRYVSLDYIQTEYFKQQNNKSDDEL